MSAAPEAAPDVCDHGLQRWQQGYPLRDLIGEWEHLRICVTDELERDATSAGQGSTFRVILPRTCDTRRA